MEKTKHLTKKDLIKYISKKTGLSILYTNLLVKDIFLEIKKIIKTGGLNVKNFGVFKLKDKSERTGRNPKNNKLYKIKARKSLSFYASNKLKKKLENELE